MPFPVLGSNSAVAGYEIDNSLRGSDSGKLSRTPSSAGNRQTFTISTWVKLSRIEHVFPIYNVGTGVGDDTNFQFRFTGAGKLFIAGGATSYRQTNAQFRDPSAWYHVVMAFDSTNGTADDRIKLWVNGVQQTSWATNNTVTLNQNTPVNNTSDAHYLGAGGDGSTDLFEGYFAEFHLIDGQAKAETDFGEYNDNGVWIPKEYEGTYGTNGVYFKWADSGDPGADSSGNGNTYTSTNNTAEDNTTDTPTNNFATFNPLILGTGFNPTFSEGNTKVVVDSGGKHGGYSSIGIASGKWYAEFKCVTTIVSVLGIVNDPAEQVRSLGKPGEGANDVGYLSNNGNKLINDVGSTHGATYTNNDIVMVALDLDNNNVYFGTNGNWADGSGSNNQSSPTSAISITDPASTPTGFYFFGTGDNDGGGSGGWEANFGNAPYTISSGNSDANGYGNFEYAVPSGYHALCTKNLAEYG